MSPPKKQKHANHGTGESTRSDNKPRVRLDKWLWAARFYKTRAIAKEMIEGGKIRYNGQRIKPGKEVSPGATIILRQGPDEKTIIVKGVAEKRGGAPQAALLYEETEESIAKRQADKAMRKSVAISKPEPQSRPNKKQRRQITRFNEQR